MLQGSGPITKKITEKNSIKHHPGDRFQDVMGGEFFNRAFRKSLVLSQESQIRNNYSPGSRAEQPRSLYQMFEEV